MGGGGCGGGGDGGGDKQPLLTAGWRSLPVFVSETRAICIQPGPARQQRQNDKQLQPGRRDFIPGAVTAEECRVGLERTLTLGLSESGPLDGGRRVNGRGWRRKMSAVMRFFYSVAPKRSNQRAAWLERRRLRIV